MPIAALTFAVLRMHIPASTYTVSAWLTRMYTPVLSVVYRNLVTVNAMLQELEKFRKMRQILPYSYQMKRGKIFDSAQKGVVSYPLSCNKGNAHNQAE